jgi:hypothetical protein
VPDDRRRILLLLPIARVMHFHRYRRSVDDNLRGDVRQFASLPGFDLLPHRLEVPLHAVNADRDGIEERKRLRVFRENGPQRPEKRWKLRPRPQRRCRPEYS